MIDDVVILGGGAIGCASALALARAGVRARVIERAHPGAEASGAAAGILGGYSESHDSGPLAHLCLQSLQLYAAWSASLVEATGIDVGYRPSGSMRAYFSAAELEREAAAITASFQGDALLLGAAAARAAEPALAPTIAGALRFPKDCRVDPPALMRALEAAARGAGVAFTTGARAARVLVEGSRAAGAVLDDGTTIPAECVVLTAGAWSSLEGSGVEPAHVEPIRGQMIELRTQARPIDHVVYGPGAYLSPRDDGRVIVGATQERAGYRKAVTVSGVLGLLSSAAALVPSLADAEISATWSGLRPATPDGAPLLGRGGLRDLIVATGHFRNGILLAPVTGDIVAALVLGLAPPADLSPFDVGRFARR